MKHIREIEKNGLLWVNVSHQSEKVLKQMNQRFNFHEADIRESLPPFERPKIIKRPDYYFMVLHFPVFDRVTRRLGFTEVDFFLSKNYLVTIHNKNLPVLEEMFIQCRQDYNGGKLFDQTSVQILFELLTRLLDAIFPILLHINEDINLIDKKLFKKTSGHEIAEEILRLKSNIVTFRRTMQGHRTVLERLIMYSGKELDLINYQGYINNIREFTNEIWHMLESQKESINALHETNESIVNLRINEVMKTLTLISVITLPVTLVATLFAIDAGGRPFIDLPYGFWLICATILLGVVMMVIIIKRKKWM